MKKTLFAVAALATMMPAMADNWKLGVAFVDPYESFTDYTKYTLYLTEQDNTDITSVKTMLEGKTFSEFTTTIASGNSIAFEDYEPSPVNQIYTQSSYTDTEFSTGLTPQGNIWGVCVYQNEDVVRFQVLEVSMAANGSFGFDTDPIAGIPGSGYTTFGSGSPTTPEPATATLSLLALAGLASRRRRK